MTSGVQVLQTLLDSGPQTRPEVAAAVGLSKPTVSDAIRRLEAAHLVRATGQRHGARGRSPVAYDLAPDAGYVLAADIGGANLRVMACDLRGERIASLTRPTEPLGGKAVAAQVVDLLHALLAGAALDPSHILALAVSTPGVVDPETAEVSLCYNIGQTEAFDLRSLLTAHFPVRTVLDNNVNCAARGEQQRGHARGVPTFAFISVGAGIGMGLVYEGKVLHGRRGAAGEIGYFPLALDPFAPEHRRRGALEDEASGPGMLDAAARRDGWPDSPPASVEELFALAKDGVAPALAVIEREAQLLGMAVATVCAVLDPHLVVLGGGIGANHQLLAGVREVVENLFPTPPQLESTKLGREASLYGAADIALDVARRELLQRAAECDRDLAQVEPVP
jgi:predicted NBD/HSP70 family sugar kinase